MGFFSDLLGTVATVGGALVGARLGLPAPVPAATTAMVPATTAAGLQLSRVGGPILTTAQIAAGAAGQPGVVREIFRATGGQITGRQRKRTIVETFDPVSGAVTARTTTPGGVAVFSRDVAAARRVFRQVSKLNAKIPRKTVKQSPVKQLTDRVIRNALERAGDTDCPPKCP